MPHALDLAVPSTHAAQPESNSLTQLSLRLKGPCGRGQSKVQCARPYVGVDIGMVVFTSVTFCFCTTAHAHAACEIYPGMQSHAHGRLSAALGMRSRSSRSHASACGSSSPNLRLSSSALLRTFTRFSFWRISSKSNISCIVGGVIGL